MIQVMGFLRAVLDLVFLGFSLFLTGNALISVGASAMATLTRHRRYMRLARRMMRTSAVREWQAILFGVLPPIIIGAMTRLADPSTYLLTQGWLTVVFLSFGGWAMLYGLKLLLYKYPRHPALFLPAGVLAVLLLLPAAPSFVVTGDFANKPDLFGGVDSLFRALTYPPVAVRVLHVITTGVLLGGLTVCTVSYRRTRKLPVHAPIRNFYAWVYDYGLRWALGALVGQAALGPAMLLSLPPEARHTLLGGAPRGTALLVVGIVTAAIATLAALFLRRAKRPGRALGTLGILVGIVLVVMGTLHTQVKPYQNGPYFGEVPPHLVPTVLKQPRCGW
ncbi:MAG: hypothetical protein IRY98_11100 [Alicyclobacillaceae bacterium]|nr:hypothetical protein [Alicyclobacillaceae bacterium]